MAQQAITNPKKRRLQLETKSDDSSSAERVAKKAKRAPSNAGNDTRQRHSGNQVRGQSPQEVANATASDPPRAEPSEHQKARLPSPVSKMTTAKAKAGPKAKQPLLRPGKVRKLAPPRPFPSVPTSVSATGPKSAHKEGKNFICITRRTPLGAYLRRCKELVLNDGYRSIHLNALGAAIPHLTRLAVSLPSILPYPADEIHTDIRTGTAELRDEIIPDDEDEDITIRTRGKSTLSVVIRIGDGVSESQSSTAHRTMKKGRKGKQRKNFSGARNIDNSMKQTVVEPRVVQEADQDEQDMQS